MGKKPFDKFINKVESGAKKKERIRQEKRQLRAEKNAYFEEQKKLAKERRAGKIQDAGYRGESRDEKGDTKGRRVDSRKPVPPQQRTFEARKPGNNSGGTKHESAPKKIIRKKPANDRGEIQLHKTKPEYKTKLTPPQKSSAENKRTTPNSAENDQMPLNKFIAWSGVCGRREAAELIKTGKVSVNNQTVTSPPFRVSVNDIVKVAGKKVTPQKNLVYILLNKPKDYITTTGDPEGRKTVMDLVKQATTERVFPVGRLDRNTTGVLLITNDGELAQRLTHPKYEVKKIYEVRLDKAVTKQQLDQIANGITLEDGFIQPDAVAYADTKDKSVIGIEIHSGRNRIVRRIFEHFGFKVKNLDRVMYGIFTKKNVDRGKWRFLTEKEIRLLKHLNTSFAGKKPSA